MWTTRQANRTAHAMDALSVLFPLAMGASAASHQDWLGVAVWTAMLGFMARRLWRRWSSGAEASMLSGGAADERDAYIQLRAWANVGQVALGGASVLALLAVLRTGMAWTLWPLVGFGVVQTGSVLWLRARS
ncbi:hypothetical protein [Catellatospora chokoriensis]|uniref:Uncharacterized protein n=1 Tax=Catellatospora chokoriensis TaxID=310353 RepID=A0A8J3KEZ1_9ACTN|nr:hypothetical protein [Catellatospora chokoriensis]GIF94669.1 hypothetical protein Cch02nite_81130 [Catellatospora chokoriensis]